MVGLPAGGAGVVAVLLLSCSEGMGQNRGRSPAASGQSGDFFEENVAPELRLIRRGRKRLVPVAELERWTVENASAPVAAEIRR